MCKPLRNWNGFHHFCATDLVIFTQDVMDVEQKQQMHHLRWYLAQIFNDGWFYWFDIFFEISKCTYDCNAKKTFGNFDAFCANSVCGALWQPCFTRLNTVLSFLIFILEIDCYHYLVTFMLLTGAAQMMLWFKCSDWFELFIMKTCTESYKCVFEYVTSTFNCKSVNLNIFFDLNMFIDVNGIMWGSKLLFIVRYNRY